MSGKRERPAGDKPGAWETGREKISINCPQYSILHASVQAPEDEPEISQTDLLAAMAKEPLLTDFGFGVFAAYRLSKAEQLAEFEYNRELLKKRLDMFRLCCRWLNLCERRKTVNLSWTSYHLKHRVEAYFKGSYVTNGSFCLATIHLGIPYKVYSGRPNITIAISNKLPKEGGGK